jgi:hypothetical protein
MQIKVFFATMSNYDEVVDEMNIFMRSHKVSGPPREEFYVGDGGPIWCFLLRYTEGAAPSSSQQSGGWNRDKKDWAKELTKGQYELFEELKPFRRKVADEVGQGNQVYKVLTDAELAEICKLKKFTVAEALKINGIGQSKKEYIESLFKLHREWLDEEMAKGADEFLNGEPVKITVTKNSPAKDHKTAVNEATFNMLKEAAAAREERKAQEASSKTPELPLT